MKKGLVVVRSISGSNQTLIKEYTSVTSNQVLNWDQMVEKGFIKEFDSFKDVEEYQKGIGFKKTPKNIWEDEAETIQNLVDSNTKDELQEMLAKSGFEGEISESWNKTELATKIIEK